MSYWAEIDETNKVIRVLKGDNDDPAGDEGYSWLVDNLGGTWLKTSYNAAINGYRKNYAAADFTYDARLDAFIPPRPAAAIGFDEETCQWIVPPPVFPDEA